MQRSTTRKGTEDRTTTYDWMVDVRTFFTDLCTWGTEPGSPLAQHMPVAIPLTTREIPNIRTYALRTWHEAAQRLAARHDDTAAIRAERDRFWD